MPLSGLEIGLLASALGVGATNTTIQGVQGRKGFKLGKWNLKWQQGVQRETWRRQDTAMQRTVADMKAAGLNPVLAAGGSPTSSGPISSTDPPKPAVPQVDLDLPMAAMSMMKMKQDIAATKAQEKLLVKQGWKATEEARAAGAKADETSYNLKWYKGQGLKGLPTNSSNRMKEIGAASDLVRGLFEANIKAKSPESRVNDVKKGNAGSLNRKLFKGFYPPIKK